MTDEPEKVDLASPDLATQARTALAELFPGVLQDGVLDVAKLGELLGVDVTAPADGRERYGLMWAGKAEAVRSLQTPSHATLVPDLDRSVDWDTAQNVFIEGDNLEVLKLLQKAYNDRVKLIYIDPPYNTGNESDFVYRDNFRDGLRGYLDFTGQTDDAGNRVSTDSDAAGGRLHSAWLNMMYPRLLLARNLLERDGVLCISIDDREVGNLRILCNEIFGEENFVDCFIWKRRYGGGPKEKHIVSIHEYVLVYARDLDSLGPLYVGMERDQVERYYKQKDDRFETLGPYRTQPMEPAASMGDRPNLRFAITAPDGTEIWPKRQWLWSRERVQAALDAGLIEFKQSNGSWTVAIKQYLRDPEGDERKTKLTSIIDGIYGQTGSAKLKELFDGIDPFPFSKPWEMIDKLVEVFTNSDSLVMDFFAGSGSTAHAVYERNAVDGGTRRMLSVQLPEPVVADSVAQSAGFNVVSEITVARIKKVMQATTGAVGQGLRALRLDQGNFVTPGSQDEAELTLTSATIREATPDLTSIATEAILKEGIPLDVPWTHDTVGGAPVVVAGKVAVVLSLDIDDEVVSAVLALKPEVLVFLEDGFAGRDAVKANAATRAKQLGIKLKTV